MQAGLYDILRGSFDNDLPISAVAEEDQALMSVVSNLGCLLNTRRGSVEHMPDYGLPDLASLYRGMPDSIDDLVRFIKEAVEKYEPRLRRVRVKPLPSESSEMRITIMITGELEGRRVRFQTTFSSNDLVHVGQYTRRD